MQYKAKGTKPCPFCGWKKQSIIVKSDAKWHTEHSDFDYKTLETKNVETRYFSKESVYVRCNKCFSKSRKIKTPTLTNVKWEANVEYDYKNHRYLKYEPPNELNEFVEKAVEAWNKRVEE